MYSSSILIKFGLMIRGGTILNVGPRGDDPRRRRSCSSIGVSRPLPYVALGASLVVVIHQYLFLRRRHLP